MKSLAKQITTIYSSDVSLNNSQEISQNKQKLFKIFFSIVCLVNFIIGYNIDKKTITNENSNLTLYLKYFIYLYTYIILVSFFIGVFIGIIFIIFYNINKCLTNKKKINFNYDSANDVNFINVTVVIFIFNLIIIYAVAVPSGCYLFYNLLHNPYFVDYSRFYLIYLFIINNILLGIFVISSFIHVLFFIHIKINNKQRIKIDEELIKHIEKEIRNTSKHSGFISNNKNENLIKINDYFNKQEIEFQKK